ncbi:MAG: hypothetical protein DME85_07715, partial [Verrucomicrobia bacterium]
MVSEKHSDRWTTDYADITNGPDRSGQQATPQRIRFQIRKWLHPTSLGAEEERVTTERSSCMEVLGRSASWPGAVG